MPSRKTTTVALVAVLASAAVAATALTSLAPRASAGDIRFSPTADTYVNNRYASTNYGTSKQLGADNSPVKRMFLKFDVTGITKPITRATLRIHVDDVAGAESGSGGTFRAMSNTSWSETSVTYGNRPSIDGTVLGTLGSVSRNTWYKVDVTSYVKGNGSFGIGVTSSSSNGADYDSRETGATAPQLVIETGGGPTPTTPTPSGSTTPPPGDPVLVGAGDIATSGSGDTATAKLLDNIPGTVFTVGDNAYPNGTASDFSTYYEPTWGRHKARTRPAPGNHDYHTSGASAYYNYFGTKAGAAGKGYYSYDLGNWHVVALNSETGMAVGSAQEQWLRADLAASTKPCTVAYWHKPRWTSSSGHAPDPATGPLVQALYDNNAEVILTGHNHQYERFAPQNPSGRLDTARGLRQFVAGMGGASLYGFGTIKPNSEARNNDTFGVLKLTLHASSYDWQFVPVAGKTYKDSGTGTCH
ncbi:DNRLRE domain-containing protein [Streptomyces sp. Isolate_45]|uniref:CBM96 family carbohydrate-binding protein n=1 Tax=Streptomyces sp. Isolate_45 TaxID=2950111 RepID=UPI002481DC4C|nr:DNRLRE domain-containing protein [Streptomyces sp. Isolate_45]MDA5279572.1 DNRLRE domain-containing protein [Streptomyces sp. Isolate_45]